MMMSSGWGSIGGHALKLDREERNKQKKQAQLMLHLWEMTAETDKKEKEMKLKERIVIQRRLIRKCDKYLREKVNAELNKKTKIIDEEAIKRKTMAQSLVYSAGIKKSLRYDKNSTVFVKSAQRFFSTYQHERDDEPASSEANPFPSDNSRMVTPNRDNDGYKDDGQASMTTAANETLSNVVHTAEERPTPSKEAFFKKPENRIAKYIGIEAKDPIKMDDMWNGLKNHGDKQLRPLIKNMKRLKKIACPSTKECMEQYKKPVAIDCYTGKPIFLTAVLSKQRQVNPPTNYYIVKYNKSVAADKCNFGCKMADRVRTASNLDEMEDNSNWFTLSETNDNKIPLCHNNPQSDSLHSTTPTNTVNDRVGTSEAGNGMQFLTKDNRILSSRSKSASRNNEHHKSTKHTDGTTITTTSTSTTTTTSSTSQYGNSSRSSQWHPLSVTALSDYQGVKERVLSGHGKFKHGYSTLWKNTEL